MMRAKVEAGGHDGEQSGHAPHGARRGGGRGGGVRRDTSDGAGGRAQDFRAGSWRLAWRLVLEARRRQSRTARPQGFCAVAHRQRRSLASFEQGRDPRHPHRRHRQPGEMGRPQRHLPRRSFLWRLAGLGRARTDPRPRRGDRLARRVQAGERPEGHRLRVGVQPQGAGGGGGQGRARPQGAAGEDVLAQREGLRLDRIPS